MADPPTREASNPIAMRRMASSFRGPSKRRRERSISADADAAGSTSPGASVNVGCRYARRHHSRTYEASGGRRRIARWARVELRDVEDRVVPGRMIRLHEGVGAIAIRAVWLTERDAADGVWIGRDRRLPGSPADNIEASVLLRRGVHFGRCHAISLTGVPGV